jgi:periplasmic protein TonB
MFDILVESSKQKQGRRARRLFLVTGAIYAVALTVLGVATIIGFNSALAEEYDVTISLVPPVPSGPAPQPESIQSNPKQGLAPRFEPPKDIKVIRDLPRLEDLNHGVKRELIPGAPYALGSDGKNGIYGAPPSDETALPPPPPPPVVKPSPTPTPAQVVRLTSVLTQGRVLRRVQPPYPAIAKQARVQGQVQVQIGISETGAVTDVTLLSGHPLLRDAALQAAKQWAFIPTELNGQRVRAIGLLTFNFKLD